MLTSVASVAALGLYRADNSVSGKEWLISSKIVLIALAE